MGSDPFGYNAGNVLGPITHGATVTLHDTNELASYPRALWVGTGGTLVLVTTGGDTLTLTSIPSGTLLPIRAKIVKATGSTASNVVALW